MKKEIKLKLITALFFILLLIPAFMGGYYWGRYTGSYGVQKLVSGGEGLLFLLFRPAHQFFHTYSMLNSNSEVIRLSGYYSLLDNNIIDEDFLMERYRDEGSIPVKRTIIWLMGFSDDFEKIKGYFNTTYNESHTEVKREILRIIRRRNPDYYKKFIVIKKVSKDLWVDEADYDPPSFLYTCQSSRDQRDH